jgi:hypothetical protein
MAAAAILVAVAILMHKIDACKNALAQLPLQTLLRILEAPGFEESTRMKPSIEANDPLVRALALDLILTFPA